MSALVSHTKSIDTRYWFTTVSNQITPCEHYTTDTLCYIKTFPNCRMFKIFLLVFQYSIISFLSFFFLTATNQMIGTVRIFRIYRILKIECSSWCLVLICCLYLLFFGVFFKLYPVSAFTPASTWMKAAWHRTMWSPTQEKKHNKLSPNNGSKQNFAMATNEKIIFIKAIAFKSFF